MDTGKLCPRITQAEPSARAGVPGVSEAGVFGMHLLAANSASLKRPPPPPPPPLLQEWKEVLSEDRIWMSVQNMFLLTTASL